MASREARDLFDSACFWAVVAIAAWAPFPFASARPWSTSVLTLVVGLTTTTQAAGMLARGRDNRPLPRAVLWAGLLFAGAMAWAIVQCLPWVPEAWTHRIWSVAAQLLPDQKLVPHISLDPVASETRILRLLTYAAIFWLGFHCCRDGARARALVRATALVGAAYATWGLLVYWSGNHSVLWFDKWAYSTDLTSTFVNRNHYAVYCGLAVLAALGLLVATLLHEIDLGETRRTLLASLAELLTARLAWLVGALLVTGTALLLTHSRGGAMVSAAGIAALLGAVSLAPSLRRDRRLGFALTIGIGLAALLLLVISGTGTLTRVADTSLDAESRRRIYAYTLQAIAERPLLGTGLGTFETVFQAYRDDTLHLVVEYAHNDYLESALELGIPAALLLLSAPAVLFFTCIRGIIRRRRDAIVPAVGVAATVLVGLHSLIDFSLQIPAVATSFYLLLGAGVAQSYPSGERAPG